MADEKRVERAWEFWRQSIDPSIGPSTMVDFAESEVRRVVEEIVGRMRHDAPRYKGIRCGVHIVLGNIAAEIEREYLSGKGEKR